ncbi:hypothetical protein [Nostoc sp. DedQUE09]|uniref:hypothetical protein n=1 Tax=Nostoc sp. DedQUE09 TaxID=3075394 RepID=UPI002AD1D846|nr:hypothetical protein [Nostoc sp. DedQUE09]MDZ7955021.1 hypothetical protein [Nostoc sp. DedQUE09]
MSLPSPSPNIARGANSPVPFLSIWEKGLGDEGIEPLLLPNFYLKFTPTTDVRP